MQMARDELGLPVGVLVNRDGGGDAGVDEYCATEGIPILMRIPLDRRIAEAILCQLCSRCYEVCCFDAVNREAVAEMSGVTEQETEVVGYVGSGELNALLKEEI
jgi:hypothetical protein